MAVICTSAIEMNTAPLYSVRGESQDKDLRSHGVRRSFGWLANNSQESFDGAQDERTHIEIRLCSSVHAEPVEAFRWFS